MWCHKPRDNKVSKRGKRWLSSMNTGKSSKMGLKNIYWMSMSLVTLAKGAVSFLVLIQH